MYWRVAPIYVTYVLRALAPSGAEKFSK